MKTLLAVFLLATGIASQIGAAVITYSHTGGAAPTTEGWFETGEKIGITAGSITNDNGTGLDAWFVNDSSLDLNSFVHYNKTPTDEQIAQASSEGWSMSTNLRMVIGTTGIFDGMFIDYINGSTQFVLEFDRESDGDPTVTAFGFASYTLEGEGDSEYHFYEMVFDPASSTADVFVDGIERISNYAGSSGTIKRVAWGAAGSHATGQGNFNSVTFTVIPEPSTTGLIALASAVLLLFRRRK